MTATEPAYARAGTTDLYWADPADPVAAFLATDPGRLGDTPSLSSTWTDERGAYVFLGAPAADGAAFLAALREWIATYRPDGPPRFLWVLDPAQPPVAWTVTEIAVTAGTGGTWLLDGGDFALADYRLVVRGEVPVAPGANGDAGWGFVLTDTADAPALSLYSPSDLFPARAGSGLLGIGGGWRFVLDLAPADGDGFARLGAGMRYFTPGDGGYVDAVRFAVVRQPAQAVTLYAGVDPQRPFDGERSSLGFFSWTGAGTAPALPSGYATAYGYDVTLAPQASGATTATPARLVFAFAPQFVGEAVNGGYYLAPDGAFGLGVEPPPGVTATSADGIDRVVCGTSGLEYLGIPAGGDCALTFVPGQPAFAPLGADTTGGDALTGPGTTSWVYVESPATATVSYYSQPEDAPLFAAPAPGARGGVADGTVDLLGFLEIPAATLPPTAPATDAAPRAFPMVPFRGLDDGAVAAAVAIEQLALAPRRRAALTTPPAPDAGANAVPRVGVTPQGLGAGIGADGTTWDWLGIGHTGGPATQPDLCFTQVTGEFRQAMQTNNLFMVLGNAAEFARCGSVAYRLTTYELDVIKTLPDGQGVPAPVLDAVRAAMAGKTYPTRTAFRDALVAAVPAITPDEEKVFLRFGGVLTPVVGGWPFRLAPDAWGPGTFLLFKFVLGRSIAELVRDVSTWSWPAAASATGSPADAQQAIAGVIAAARAAAGDSDTSPYANFVEVVDDRNWTGVLALSAEVPLEQLPSELQVLAAGIDPGSFRAHHFGMSVTPYRLSGGQVSFQRSSMFGLIDYQNPEDQYFSENVSFAFRVLQLTIGIRNSVVTTFASRAELLVNRLFGTPARLFPTTHGNNVILDGAHQQQRLPDGSTHDTYVFSMSGYNVFQLNGQVLQSVELLSTQLVTAKASDPSTGDATVQAVFQLAGNLRFYEAPGFDPFCWGPAAGGEDGYLRFGNLGIAMTFSLGDPAGTTAFRLNDGNLSFDAANSKARPDALVSRFPIRLSGLVATADPALSAPAPPPPPQTPADMGFVSVTAPIQQSTLTQPWYGLDYTIDLGTLGALSGNTAIALQVLVAWSPGATGTEPAVYVGVKLPGVKDALGVSLPLQGVVKLGFKGIELLVDNVAGQPRTYTLRMRDFALRLLGLAFPPGHNDVILFGNPDQSGSSKVGWYVAYASDADPKRPPKPPSRESVHRLRAAVRGGNGG